MKTISCVVVLVLAFTSFVPAQDGEARVIVLVKDQLGSTISDADIVLSRTGGRDKKIKSNSQGTGQFLKLAAGEYRLEVSAEGFQGETQNLILASGETRRVEVILDIAPIESTVDIGDDAADAERTGKTTVITEDQIANLPDDQEALEQAIRRLGEVITGEDLPVTVNGVQG
ncbi:MAG TPA: hypothetical protein DEP46_12130, partial [Blastocatellia bacterium]|nr:hypothetical protein [Blastocatellia bacterium]